MIFSISQYIIELFSLSFIYWLIYKWEKQIQWKQSFRKHILWILLFSKYFERKVKWIWPCTMLLALLEKCPNTMFFLVRIFLYSDWIRRFNVNLSIQSEYRKILNRKNSVFGHFSRSVDIRWNMYYKCVK